MAKDDFTIEFDQANNTNIAFGTTADYAYTLWLAKKKQIADLEYECDILVDKYHTEMCRGNIPFFLKPDFIDSIFGDKVGDKKYARKTFLRFAFTEGFADEFPVKFVERMYIGYHRNAVIIVLAIGDYEYKIECPCPQNNIVPKEKKTLVGKVKFRVDRLHKSKKNDFVHQMEPVQMPTYDWKKCFEAIEAIVEKEGK